MKMPTQKKQNDKYLTPVYDNSGALKGYRFTPGPTLRAQGLKPQMLKMPNGAWMDHITARIARDTILRTAQPVIVKAPKSPTTYLTLKRAFELFESYFQKQVDNGSRSKSSLRTYSIQIKSWYDYLGEDANIEEIDAEIIQETIDLMLDEGIKLANAHGRLAAIQNVFIYLKKHMKFKHISPINGIILNKAEHRKVIATEPEIHLLVNTADKLATETGNKNFYSIGTAIIAAIWTAQRVGDLLNCDLDQQLSFENNRNRISFNQEKTNAAIMVPILPPLEERIKGRNGGFLIQKKNLKKWSYAHFRQYFSAVRKEAYNSLKASKIIPKGIDIEKIKTLHFHDFRGTAITRLYSAGCTPIDIASWSGHSIQTVTSMLKVYCVFQQERADEAGDKLFEYFKRNNLRI